MSTAADNQSQTREQRHRHLQTESLFKNGGSRQWKNWKATALDDLLQMAQQAPRLEFLQVDLRGDLDLVYRIRQPVPRWPVGGKLIIGHEAVYHMVYQPDWLVEPPPGWGLLGLFHPLDVFHSNAREAPLRAGLCLGRLPPAVAAKEVLLKGYFMLCLVDYTLSELDPEGVLNRNACDYYRSHPEYLPLTHAGLYDPWQPDEERGLAPSRLPHPR